MTYLEPVVANGLRSVLLFGVPEKVRKEQDGGTGETEDNPVLEAVRRIKSKFPELTVACDVCLCPFTSHGHCGVLFPGILVCCTQVLWCVVPWFFGVLYSGTLCCTQVSEMMCYYTGVSVTSRTEVFAQY